MDIVFTCPDCNQEMVVDAQGAGSEIECPSCELLLTIPEADAANVKIYPPAQTVAREEKQFTVPSHEGPAESLITKSRPPLETQKDGDKILRIKTIRHGDCREVGHDVFDERVTEILNQIGEAHIVSINTINYSYVDLASKQQLNRLHPAAAVVTTVAAIVTTVAAAAAATTVVVEAVAVKATL